MLSRNSNPDRLPVRKLGRITRVVPLLLIGIMLWGFVAWAQSPKYPIWSAKPKEAESSGDRITPSLGGSRMREGSKLKSQLGYFRNTGDRVTFFTANGSERFIGLENLSLERIAKIVDRNPSPMEWDVTGMVTEYRGVNFLLIDRAVLRNESEILEAIPTQGASVP